MRDDTFVTNSNSSSHNQGLSRRRFLICAASVPVVLSMSRVDAIAQTFGQQGRAVAPYGLPPLPYGYGALSPAIDSLTMRLHHDRHHAAYVKNLNEAVAAFPELVSKTPQELIRALDAIPEAVRSKIRNNGGGHVNHSMFWQIMSPRGGGRPSGAIGSAINSSFGSFEAFKSAFEKAGLARFGSGWVWLVYGSDNRLQIITTPNQDNPMMKEYGGLFPIMGNDVWEHAYYLKYKNKRAAYLKAWWSVVNWDEVNRRLAVAAR
jgi:Fe-Mn family superoxide dismutase